MLQPKRLTFTAAWEDRTEATIDDLVLPVPDRASLIHLRDLDALGEV